MASSDALRALMRGCTRQRNDTRHGVTKNGMKSNINVNGDRKKKNNDNDNDNEEDRKDDDNDTSQTKEGKGEGKLPAHLDFFQCNALPAPLQRAGTARKDNRNDEDHDKTDATTDNDLATLLTDTHLQSCVRSLSLCSPTAVQRAAIPSMLCGHDVTGIAPTGSGKTLAYLLPLLDLLLLLPITTEQQHHVRVVVVAPTRELVAQIARVLDRILKAATLKKKLRYMCIVSHAGVTKNALQDASRKVDIVIATPQSLLSAVQGGALDVTHLEHVVLDEADELLSVNFVAQTDALLSSFGIHPTQPSSTTTTTDNDNDKDKDKDKDNDKDKDKDKDKDGTRLHLFSATWPQTVQQLVRTLQRRPAHALVSTAAYDGTAAVSGLASSVSQTFRFAGGEQGKLLELRSLFRSGILRPPVLLFVSSRDRADPLVTELRADHIVADSLHSGRTPAARAATLARFRRGEVWALVGTDVLARGLDFATVHAVVNYDVPTSVQMYVHRIGRCGRNGKSGIAVTLFTTLDTFIIARLARIAKASGAQNVPDWLVHVKPSAPQVQKKLDGSFTPLVKRQVKNSELYKLQPKRMPVGGSNRASLIHNHAHKHARKRHRPATDADDIEKEEEEEEEGEGGEKEEDDDGKEKAGESGNGEKKMKKKKKNKKKNKAKKQKMNDEE